MSDNPFLNASFLGPYGENNELFESVLTELVRDHVYWRRNFHPMDAPPISTRAAFEPEYADTVAKMKQELHLLTARLKSSVPMYNPRYIGHMASDLLLPGLLAQIVTTLYNPNNISNDSAPATVEMELEVGKQLAKMFGFSTVGYETPCAFGHVTSGGTVANYEGMWLMRAVRFLPLAIKQACQQTGIRLSCCWGESVAEADSWRLVNLPVADILNLYERVALLAPEERDILNEAIDAHRYELMGARAFFDEHSEIGDGIVIVPRTAHYSWAKAMRFLGLGEQNLWQVAVDGKMRMDADELEAILIKAYEQKRPVIGVVAVLGTTEFGTIDPVHKIVALKQQREQLGQSFAIHIDAAWGGYLTSMFRAEDGSLLPLEQVRDGCDHFPGEPTYQAFAALSEVDSVTVDPHKLGFIPFGCGAFVVRDNRLSRLILQKAAYVFGEGNVDDFSQLGQFIIEGSKPGATAAAAYVCHKVLPLDAGHFGRIPQVDGKNTELFEDKLSHLAERMADEVEVLVPVEPDSNLLCIAFNPKGNRDVRRMNRFNEQFYQHIKTDLDLAIQRNEFFGSSTRLYTGKLTEAAYSQLCDRLQLEPGQLLHPSQPVEQATADSLFLIRHTLMNPWLTDSSNGNTYLDMYCEFIERTLLALLYGESSADK